MSATKWRQVIGGGVLWYYLNIPVEEQTSDNRRILYLLRNIYLNIIFYLFNHYLFCKAVKVYMAINIDLKKQKPLLNTLTATKWRQVIGGGVLWYYLNIHLSYPLDQLICCSKDCC
jgi:hypothetical protein